MPRFSDVGQRLHVAVLDVLVVGRVAREGRDPLEGGDRLGHPVEGHVGAEDLLELLLVARDRAEPVDDLLVRLVAHLDLVLDRALRLAFERRGAAVPEHRPAIGRVQDRRGVAAADLPVDADGGLDAVGPALLGVVAGRAADRAVLGDAGVEVELLAQLQLGLGDRVGRRHRDVHGQRVQPFGGVTTRGSSLMASSLGGNQR